jgi:hypothetical protein
MTSVKPLDSLQPISLGINDDGSDVRSGDCRFTLTHLLAGISSFWLLDTDI